MKRSALALVIVLAMSGCSSLSGSLNHLVDPKPSPTPTQTCRQQFIDWDFHQNPAKIARLKAAVKNLKRQLDHRPLTAVGELRHFTRGIRKVSSAWVSFPTIPYCADPKGYFDKMSAKMWGSGFDVRLKGASRSQILHALSQWKQVPELQAELNSELLRRVHISWYASEPPTQNHDATVSYSSSSCSSSASRSKPSSTPGSASGRFFCVMSAICTMRPSTAATAVMPSTPCCSDTASTWRWTASA